MTPIVSTRLQRMSMSLFKRYEASVGDQVWFWTLDGHGGRMSVQGTVMHVFPPGWGGYMFKHYVVERPTHVDPILEILPDWQVYGERGQCNHSNWVNDLKERLRQEHERSTAVCTTCRHGESEHAAKWPACGHFGCDCPDFCGDDDDEYDEDDEPWKTK